MNIIEDTEDVTKLAMRNQEFLKSKEYKSTPLPQSRSKKALVKSEPNINSDTANLKKLVDDITPDIPYKKYERLDNLLTSLRHKGILASISLDILLDFTVKIKEIITKNSEINYGKNYIKEVKSLIKILEPSKVYLNLIGTPNIDQRLLLDEVFESILKIIKNCLDKLVIPLSLHPTKDFLKVLENKKVKMCMASLCGVLEYLAALISKKCFQEYLLMDLSELLIKTLFSEGAEVLHLTCCYTIASIVNSYNKITLQVIDEIINNVITLTSDPNLAMGSKTKRIHCRDYSVAEGVDIKFSTFMLVHVLQNYSSLASPIKVNGEVDLRLVDQQLQETLGLAQHFINEVCERAFKVRSDCQEYRVFLDSFIQDLLKLIYRPDFPIAYQMLNIITVKLFTGLKTYSAVIRHYIIDELSLVSSNLKSSIHDIKQSPIVPQNITKVPMTQHPSDNSMASICICNEGWSLDKSEMVQCEECWKWFHLDCVALDIEKYDDESWFCDDCRLFECLQHIEIIKPTIKDEELLALPKELIYINQQYQNVYRVLIINYLIANNNRLDESARSLWLSLWLQNNPSKALVELWQTPSKTPNLPRLSEKGTIKLLRQYLLSFDLGIIYLHIQHKIISLLNSPQPLTRAKAIKSLCSIVSADPECLVEDMIESAVTERLLDSSIAVREATVELLGKFITFKSEFSDNYYSALMERLKDKGPSVRKRVIKILKDIIESDPEHERIIEIYCEVVKRIGDDNESIREAVINMFEEVWFTTKPNKFFLSFVKIVKILKLKDPVVMLFKAILNKNEEHREKLEKITQIASEQLVASSNLKNSILYAKLLEIISLTSPELLVDQISTLHQFLTPVQNSNEESELLSSICIIIGRASEHLSSLNSTRIKRIESQLINLVYTQGSIVLTQALNALCKIVKLCSRNQKIIITLIERCFTLLLSSLQNPIEKKNLPSIYRALLALGVCIKFYDGDIYATLQLEKKKDFKTSLFDVYEKFAMQEDENLKERALDALSSTWVRFPDLLEKSDHLILKGWEMAKSPNSRIKMLQMFYEFLHHCDVNVLEGGDEDRGNVVSIIQKYLDNILDCAKNKSVEVRESAAEVLKLIYLQGQVDLSKMSSILFCMLVDESNIVKESGYFCLEKSFSKNSSIVILNLQNSLKESFEYQVDLFKSRSLSDSFYVKFYNLIKPKKSVRTKFLTQMTGLLEPTDPSFTEYLCDFLSVLPYTGLEEISPIISQITGKIQTSAFRLLRIIKVRTANKEPLDRENMIECLLQIQLIYLKNYLFNAYQLKGIEENTDKGIQKVEDINGFYEEYQEFKEYHELNQINCDDLCKFKKKFKQCLNTQGSDDLPVKKRVKKTFDAEQFLKQNLNL